jgi:uncharacterized protein
MKKISDIQLPYSIQPKIMKIEALFQGKKIIAAFSGGIDSSLVVYLANLFGQAVYAIIIKSPLTPGSELQNAAKFCEILGISLEELEINILENEHVQSNSLRRCYYCKSGILKQLESIAAKKGYDLVVDGTNLSDLDEDRPGLQALKESNVISPLALAEITKAEVLGLTALLDLPSKDIPSMACLASRVPFETPLTSILLERIDKAENYIRTLSGDWKSPLRVRIHTLPPSNKILGRIEASWPLMEIIVRPEFREKISTELLGLGFTFITVDLSGFKSGSMHQSI